MTLLTNPMNLALALYLLSACSLPLSADQGSNPIVDVRFEGPYRQVAPSMGDEWAPTWGQDDILYTGSNDGDSFGGVSRNAIAFGKLEGSDPFKLSGTTINGMLEYQELQLGPEASKWKFLDSYKIGAVFYRFMPCGPDADRATCLTSSRNGGTTWTRGEVSFREARFRHVRFLVWSKQVATTLNLNPGEHVYAASYAGVIDGEDQYFIARTPIEAFARSTEVDWSFLQHDFTWGAADRAAPLSSNGKWGADGANWKVTNSYSVDGTLYMFITRCFYPAVSSDPKRRHIFQHSSIIKSSDRGTTWIPSAEENYQKPMFPGQRFGTAYFVWYGKDGAATVDNADRYVYAVSNNGHFENGDNYVLGRVLRSKLPNLAAADWSFYRQGDGLQDSSWSSKLNYAEPVLTNPGRASMTGMTYISQLRRYVMVTWYYSQANFEAGLKANDLSTTIEFFEAPKPWGPWSKVKSFATGNLGWYVPVIGQRFQVASGKNEVNAFLYPTGFVTTAKGLDLSLYKFNYIPITLSSKPLQHRDPHYVGR